jgi:murein L,D-transpeptidase YcbB/YkuD
MTNLINVRREPRFLSVFRSMKLAALTLALAGGLGLAACQKNDAGSGLGGRDVDIALEALKAAPEHGFSPDQFHLARIEPLVRSKDPAEQARGARELRAALVAYGRAQHGLTIPKSAFPSDWGLKPADYDAEATLDQALREGKLKTWLESQPTPLPAYQALQKAYLAYLKVEAAGGWPVVSPVDLRLGAAGPEVTALRQRLAFEDASLAGQPADGPADAGLLTAVQSFQAAHGLPVTGKVDAATLAELNVPAVSRAAQIRANLERLRWLPRQQPATRIDVNTAAATMTYFENGQVRMHMLAASGKPGDDETPMLASAVDGIVLNPPWNVPQQIAQEEILPKGPEYLESKGFVMKDDGRLVQQPGPDAALGVVKFDFDNPCAVYLHDTPAKAAFAQSQRAVSHGCVRLAQAVEFAKLLLGKESNWSPERVDEVLASGETTHIKLAHPTPVRLLYLTAFVDGGRIAFRPDIYGWDAKLLQMLDNPPAPRKPGRRT